VEQQLDRELIVLLQDGELDALGVLYDRHRHLVYRTALAITGDPEMASDLLQEVFLRLYRFAHRIDSERPIQPWLYRMTTNLSYTWVKRRTRWLHFIQDMADRVILDKKPSPHLQAERDEGWQWIQQAIISLPIQQRVVVVLYYINDLSLQGYPGGHGKVKVVLCPALVKEAARHPSRSVDEGVLRDNLNCLYRARAWRLFDPVVFDP
jgi:RNA polymerase sigma-70 factor (ECF subfamily)